MPGVSGSSSYVDASSTFTIMATCPKGLESPLAKELLELGAEQIQESVAAVFFEASFQDKGRDP